MARVGAREWIGRREWLGEGRGNGMERASTEIEMNETAVRWMYGMDGYINKMDE